MNLEFSALTYRAIRDRIRAEDPQIDEQTLADTVEGLTDLHEIITAIIRSALADEALATGLKGRIADMQERLDRLQDRASKRRQIAKDVMIDLDLKKITAPDFSVSIRPGLPSLMVIDEAAVPSIYWQPSAPRLKRQELLSELKDGAEIEGVALSNPEPVLSVTGAVMGFSAKQLQALRRNLDGRHIRTREANGRELSYIEGWFAISEANRIFGFDGWSRETVESRCVLARENRGTFVAVYVAKVRITVQADGATVIREGHGSGEGRGTSPGEVHDISLKAAETDATKRAFATFGKPFGLELYRKAENRSCKFYQRSSRRPQVHRLSRVLAHIPTIRRRSRGRRVTRAAHQGTDRTLRQDQAKTMEESRHLPWRLSLPLWPGQDRQERSRHSRTQAPTRQVPSEIRGLPTVSCLRAAAIRSPPSALCTAACDRTQGQ